MILHDIRSRNMKDIVAAFGSIKRGHRVEEDANDPGCVKTPDAV